MESGWFAGKARFPRLRRRPKCKARRLGMDNIYRNLILFLLTGVGVAFMLWFLWNFYQAGRKR
jgi:hypothetical protein